MGWIANKKKENYLLAENNSLLGITISKMCYFVYK